MKKYIQKLAVALIACAGFASCADEFDATDHATYPAEAPGLGTWVADQTATSGPFTKGFLYELNITLSAAGDTVYNITSVSTPYNTVGLPANYPICSPGGKLQSYDPEAGLAYLEFDETEEGSLIGGIQTNTPACAYVAYNRAWEKLTVDMYFNFQGSLYAYQDYLGNGNFTLTKAQHPSFVSGYWLGECKGVNANDSKSYIFYLTYEQQLTQTLTCQGQCIVSREVPLDEEGNQIPEGSQTPVASYGVVQDMDYCKFVYDKTTGTATVTTVPLPVSGQEAPEAKTYTLQYNEIGQLTFVNAEGQTVILDRMAY